MATASRPERKIRDIIYKPYVFRDDKCDASCKSVPESAIEKCTILRRESSEFVRVPGSPGRLTPEVDLCFEGRKSWTSHTGSVVV
jgi:hypothetical protein